MAVCREDEMNPVLAIIKESIGNVEKFLKYMKDSPICRDYYIQKEKKPEPPPPVKTSGLPDFLRQKCNWISLY